VRERVDELRSVADDAGALLAAAGQEAGRVHEHDERQAEEVARAHEARALLGRVGVEHAAQVRRLVGDDPHRTPVQAGEAADEVAGPARCDLEQLAGVDQARDDRPDVVDPALLGGDGRVGQAGRRIDRRAQLRARADPCREVVQQPAHEEGGVRVALGGEVADAVAVVHARTAEIGCGQLLAHDLPDHRRAGEEHGRRLGHDDEVRECGGVRPAAGRCAADHRDLGHAPGEPHVLAEDAGVPAERGQALLQAGPG
jgi:hypothetical protein